MPRDTRLAPRRQSPHRLRAACAGLLAIGLCACSGKEELDADLPDVSLAGLSFAGAGLVEQGLTIQLRLRNPNDFDIPVQALDFALDVDGAAFANGLSNADFVLPALAEIIVPIDVSIATEDLIERVTAIGTGRRLDYRLTGAAEIESWFADPVSFEKAGKLALPDIPGLLRQDGQAEDAEASTG